MPHLQFEFNQSLDIEAKKPFVKAVREHFADIMDTDTGHIAISIREYDRYNLTIGRADPEVNICLMNLDIREGRTIGQRRELALQYMDLIKTLFNVEPYNQYITFTQHSGEDFHLAEKFLAEWAPEEHPLD